MLTIVLTCVVVLLAMAGGYVLVLFVLSGPQGFTTQDEPHWEVVPAWDAGEHIGYRVRWSEPDDWGSFLWVGHYLSDEETSLAWCEAAAISHCSRLTEQRRAPWEFPGYTPRSK